MDEEIKIEGKEEIEEALKKIEEEGISVQSEISPAIASDTPKMVSWVMKVFHLAQRPAEYVLIGIIIICFVLSFFLFTKDNNNTSSISIPENFENTQQFLP